MTQEALKKMYQLLLTEPHAPTVCAQLERIAREALADHAMSEVQSLGQEIEQEPKIKTTDPFESSRVADYNRGWNDCLFASGVVKQPEQEPVAWPCHIIEADFSERTITLGMECVDYKV